MNRAAPRSFSGLCPENAGDLKLAFGTSGATRTLIASLLSARPEERQMCSASSSDDACHHKSRYRPKGNTSLPYNHFRKKLIPRAPGENSPRGARTTAELGSKPNPRSSRVFL